MRVDDAPDVERREPAHRDERWYLEDLRDFLRRSLDDADRELAAGDLSGEDHALLVARDSARLVEVEEDLAALREAAAPAVSGRRGPEEAAEDTPAASAAAAATATDGPARRPLSAWRKAGIVASCLFIVLGAAILVAHFVQARQPGQAASGSISLSQAQQIEQQLQQALTDNNKGDTKVALELYDKVLSEDPSNPAALAYAGYLQWNVGSSAHVPSLVRIGRAEIQTAVKDSPSYAEAHLFEGLVLANEDHADAAAVSQFDDFVADDPTASARAQAAPLVAPAYQATGRPLPAAFSSAPTPTSTSTSTTPAPSAP